MDNPDIFTSAAAVGAIDPLALVIAWPVTSKVTPTLINGVPKAEVAAWPSGVTFAAAVVVTDPTAVDKDPTVVTDTFASAVGAIDPTELVAAWPVGITLALPVIVRDPTAAVAA